MHSCAQDLYHWCLLTELKYLRLSTQKANASCLKLVCSDWNFELFYSYPLAQESALGQKTMTYFKSEMPRSLTLIETLLFWPPCLLVSSCLILSGSAVGAWHAKFWHMKAVALPPCSSNASKPTLYSIFHAECNFELAFPWRDDAGLLNKTREASVGEIFQK